MKKLFSAITFLGLFSTILLADSNLFIKVEKNLLYTLRSENFMIKSDAIQLAGDLKMDKAVIYLLEVLKSNDDPELRILAAISLSKIEDSRDLFAIRQAVHFDYDLKVQKVCSRLLGIPCN